MRAVKGMSGYSRILQNLMQKATATQDELTALLSAADPAVESVLFQAADAVRRVRFGNVVYIRAIVEFSNYCRCQCHYCGLRADNRAVARYRMTPQEILQTAQDVADAGYRTIILQSGEDLYYTRKMLGEIVSTIKADLGLTVTLSVGEREMGDYQYWKSCGADRFLIKHETADEALYNQYHPHSTFQNRIRCIRALNAMGYEAGSGFMVGLPGTDASTHARDLLLLKDLGVAMAGIGPFIAHEQTPLRGHADGSPDLTLRTLACARLLLPNAYLPSTTALNVKGGLQDALSCGANVIMQKATPEKYRDLYDIYPGRESAPGTLKDQLASLKQALQNGGWQPE